MSDPGGLGDREAGMRRVAAAIAAGIYRVDPRDVADAVLARWASEDVGRGAISDWIAYSSEDGTASASRD